MLYDFGLAMKVSEEQRQGLALLLVSLVTCDRLSANLALRKLGIDKTFVSDVEMQMAVKTMQVVLDKSCHYGETDYQGFEGGHRLPLYPPQLMTAENALKQYPRLFRLLRQLKGLCEQIGSNMRIIPALAMVAKEGL